jgi:hypothetical protein
MCAISTIKRKPIDSKCLFRLRCYGAYGFQAVREEIGFHYSERKGVDSTRPDEGSGTRRANFLEWKNLKEPVIINRN